MSRQKSVPSNQKQQVHMQRACCLLMLCCGLLCINLGEPVYVALGTVMMVFALVLFVVVQVAARRAEAAAGTGRWSPALPGMEPEQSGGRLFPRAVNRYIIGCTRSSCSQEVDHEQTLVWGVDMPAVGRLCQHQDER